MVKNILKKTIILFLLLLLFLSTILFFIYNREERKTFEKEDWILFRIPGERFPEQLLWFKNDLFLKQGDVVKKFDFEKRVFEFFENIGLNDVLAEYEGELVNISYTNHEIQNPEEFATDISIEKISFSKSYHETIRPLYIEKDFLFLIDNYLHSPERTYRIDLKSGKIEFFEIETLSMDGEENIEVFDSKGNLLINIPKVNDISWFSTNKDYSKFALVDIEGYIWLYLRAPNG